MDPNIREGSVTYIDNEGAQQKVTIKVEDYLAAQQNNMSLASYYNRMYPTDTEQHGSTFSQFARSCGLFMSTDREFGFRAPTIKQVMDGNTAILAGGAVMRPDGSQSNTPSGRLLFPSVLTEVLESSLRDDKESYIGSFMQNVAFTTVIDSQRYDQVKINFTRPRAARGAQIAQLAEPNRMLSITVSDTQKKLAVYALGMEISDQAAAAATLDLVGLAIKEHAIEERAFQVMRDFKNLVNGSVDTGDSALSSVPITFYDPAIVANGVMTQKGWVKFLRYNWLRRRIDVVFCDLDTYLAIEGRTGRPTRDTEPATDERLNTVPEIQLPGIPGRIRIFPLEDSTILGTNTMVGMDSSKGMRRVMYVAANYNAVENFILRRSTVMRFDWSERVERLGYDEAFSKATLTTS